MNNRELDSKQMESKQLDLPEFDYSKLFSDINNTQIFGGKNEMDEILNAKRLSTKQEKEGFIDKEGIREYFRNINNLLDQEKQELDEMCMKYTK